MRSYTLGMFVADLLKSRSRLVRLWRKVRSRSWAGMVEVDETFIGGKYKNRRIDKRGGGGAAGDHQIADLILDWIDQNVE